MTSSWERYRKAGAATRAMLVEAAAREWAFQPAEISVENGMLTHSSGKLPASANWLPKPMPDASRRYSVEAPRMWKQIGNAELKRFDSTENERHAALHHRRQTARHADGGDDPSADIRRQGQVLRCLGGAL